MAEMKCRICYISRGQRTENRRQIENQNLRLVLFDVSETIEAVEPALTLEGLRVIANQA
jgi:hypothetical protein